MRPTFIVLTVLITLLVLRNAYRTAEFSSGTFTTGSFQQNEAWYLVFDPTLMSIALMVALAFNFTKRLPGSELPSMVSPAVQDIEMGSAKPMDEAHPSTPRSQSAQVVAVTVGAVSA